MIHLTSILLKWVGLKPPPRREGLFFFWVNMLLVDMCCFTPRKISMEHNHGGLEDHFPDKKGWFVGSMLIFQGVYFEESFFLRWFFSQNERHGSSKIPEAGWWVPPNSKFFFAPRKKKKLLDMWNANSSSLPYSTWWFQIFFIFTPTWGRFPFWLIFFSWVETTNQYYNWDSMGFIWGLHISLTTIGGGGPSVKRLVIELSNEKKTWLSWV